MRASGILMPVFSLPGPFGIGTLGSEATAFAAYEEVGLMATTLEVAQHHDAAEVSDVK